MLSRARLSDRLRTELLRARAVVLVGPRQSGRERSDNVVHVPFSRAAVRRALSDAWNGGNPRRFAGANVYGGGGAGRRIAAVLSRVAVNDRLLRKLIAY